MKESLFAKIENDHVQTERKQFFHKVIEERQRPEHPDLKVADTLIAKEEEILLFDKSKLKKIEIEEVRKHAADYFKGDELAANVWLNKYALKDSDGNLYERTPDDMHKRLAQEIARIEKKYPNPLSAEEVFALLKDFKYIIPQGSPMAGMGNDFQISSLSNCFVIGNQGNSDS